MTRYCICAKIQVVFEIVITYHIVRTGIISIGFEVYQIAIVSYFSKFFDIFGIFSGTLHRENSFHQALDAPQGALGLCWRSYGVHTIL